jgi:homopolymeric O-antigen transport system permease protein
VYRHLNSLYRSRELLWIWTLRDIKVRYKQSVLGAAWAVLQPLSLMLVFSLIFTYLIQVPSDGIPYPVFSYTALLPWTFLSSSISLATPSLLQNMNLVTKIYFPREILPISAILASFLDFLIASLVFLGLILYYHIPIRITFILLPFLLIVQVLLTLGLVLFASAVEVFYRDVRFIVPLAIQLWMYATPVIYPVNLVPERFRFIYMLNPMAVLIESYRAIILKGIWPEWIYLWIAAGISGLFFVFGYYYFKKVDWQFADII